MNYKRNIIGDIYNALTGKNVDMFLAENDNDDTVLVELWVSIINDIKTMKKYFHNNTEVVCAIIINRFEDVIGFESDDKIDLNKLSKIATDIIWSCRDMR